MCFACPAGISDIALRAIPPHRGSEASPNEAARILGISRPLFVHRMKIGDMPFRSVGAHRRATLRDVFALKSKFDAQRAATDERRPAGASLILTWNLRDFPAPVLKKQGLHRQTPTPFSPISLIKPRT